MKQKIQFMCFVASILFAVMTTGCNNHQAVEPTVKAQVELECNDREVEEYISKGFEAFDCHWDKNEAMDHDEIYRRVVEQE